MAALGKVSISLPVQSDNTIGTRWRTPGSKGPSSPTLVWGSLAIVAGLIANQTTGSSFSHNVRQYLSGTAAATATISIVQVSGDDATTEGWAISSAGAGNNLTHPGSGTGSGFFRLRAATGGENLDSDILGWAWVASATDTLAPTIPVAVVITPQEGALKFDWAASQDPLAGSSAASGVKDYRIRRGGSIVATVNASSPGISPAASDQQIGSYSPTPAFGYATTNGGQYSLTSAGTGTHGTLTEKCFNHGWQVSGNFKARAKVVQFNANAGYQFATAGIMVGSRTQGQPFVYLYQEPSNVAPRVQLKRRATAGTNSGNISAVSISNFAFLEITRTGDVFRTEYSIDGGTVWNLVSEITVTMPTNVYVDLCVASQVDGNEVTAIFEQVSVSNTADETYTLNPATAGSYTISARDIALNESSQSVAQTGTPLAEEPDVQTLRFNPGHYVRYDTNIRNDTTRSSTIAGIINSINSANIGSNPNIKGMVISMHWGAAEQGTTLAGSTYAQGLADLRTIADVARAKGKKLIVSFLHVLFGGTGADLTPWFPAYIANGAAQGYGWTAMSNGKITRLWQQATMDRIIAQMLAYANADNGHGVAFKDDPVIEMMSIDETSVAVTLGTDGYSIPALSAQFMRYMTAMRANSQVLPYRLVANFMGNNDQMWDILQHAVTEKFAIGGPDVIPTEAVQANRVFTGTPPVPELPDTAQTRAIVDLRGRLPFVAEVQTPSMNGHEGDFTAAQLYNFTVNGGNVTVSRPNPPGGTMLMAVRGVQESYMVWALKEWEQNSSGPTDSGGIKFSSARLGDGSPSIKDYIDSISGTVTRSSYPTDY